MRGKEGAGEGGKSVDISQKTRHSTKKDRMTPNVRSSSFYLRKRTRGTILEIRQSLSLESTLTGLRTFLVTE